MIIDGVLLVEGKTDKSYLSSFLKSEIVVLNGLEVLPSNILYLKQRNSTEKIYILTDPDQAGEQIRQKVNSYFPNAINLYVDKTECNKHHKHGVAECRKDILVNLLKPYEIVRKEDKNNQISMNDLYQLGLIGPNSSTKRKILTEKLKIGYSNNKELLKRINLLNISLEELKKEL